MLLLGECDIVNEDMVVYISEFLVSSSIAHLFSDIHQRCGVEFLSKVSFHQVLTYIINHSDFIYYCIEDKSTPNWQKRPGHIVKIMWTTQII